MLGPWREVVLPLFEPCERNGVGSDAFCFLDSPKPTIDRDIEPARGPFFHHNGELQDRRSITLFHEHGLHIGVRRLVMDVGLMRRQRPVQPRNVYGKPVERRAEAGLCSKLSAGVVPQNDVARKKQRIRRPCCGRPGKDKRYVYLLHQGRAGLGSISGLAGPGRIGGSATCVSQQKEQR